MKEWIAVFTSKDDWEPMDADNVAIAFGKHGQALTTSELQYSGYIIDNHDAFEGWNADK